MGWPNRFSTWRLEKGLLLSSMRVLWVVGVAVIISGGQDDTYLTAVVIASNDESKKLKCGDY